MKPLRTIGILCYKHCKDTLKNLHILILFIVFPILGVTIANVMPQETQEAMMSMLAVFVCMHCIFAPMSATANILAEEKEKNTMQSLILSNVTLPEYLLSIGCFILLITLLTGSAFLLVDPVLARHGMIFMIAMLIGCIVSTVFGMCVGLYVKNMASANGLAVPAAMVLSFTPMLATFNQSIENISRFTYGQQVAFFISELEIRPAGLLVVAVNLMVLLLIGVLLYRKVRTAE